MKKIKNAQKSKRSDLKDDLRPEYKLSDFSEPFVRGKYAKRMTEECNIIVLRPEIARVFKNEEDVNDALQSLIDLAQKVAPVKRNGK